MSLDEHITIGISTGGLDPDVSRRVDERIAQDHARRLSGILGTGPRNTMARMQAEAPAPPSSTCADCGAACWRPDGAALCGGCEVQRSRSKAPARPGTPPQPSRAGAFGSDPTSGEPADHPSSRPGAVIDTRSAGSSGRRRAR